MTEVRLTVLHVLEAVAAGAARHVVDLVSHTPGFRHEIAMPIARKGWTTDAYVIGALREAGAEVHVVDMRRVPLHPVNAWGVLRLRALIGERRPAIVHGHSSVGGALARLAAWTAPVSRVYTPHALSRARLAIFVERQLGHRTDCLIALSESERRLVLQLGIVPPARVALIPNGIDPDLTLAGAVDLRTELGIPAGAPVIGCVARVVAQKAPDDFARCHLAVNRTRPDVHFILIGSGPMEAAVNRIAAKAGVMRTWHHINSMPDAWRVMDQFDVLVLPSRYEGLPYAALEAMRAHTPVVLTDVDGNRELAVGGAATLVPSGDIAALADAVLALLGDASRRSAQAAVAKSLVAERFTVDQMASGTAALYTRLVRGDRPAGGA